VYIGSSFGDSELIRLSVCARRCHITASPMFDSISTPFALFPDPVFAAFILLQF